MRNVITDGEGPSHVPITRDRKYVLITMFNSARNAHHGSHKSKANAKSKVMSVHIDRECDSEIFLEFY